MPAFAPLAALVPRDVSPWNRHGDFPRWLAALRDLPDIEPAQIDLRDRVRIGASEQLSAAERDNLRAALMGLHPWRKGPLELFGVLIDTEWRSDWKWERIAPHISPLEGRAVLDVGCGNGYHCWRMAGAGAAFVLGIDPHLLYALQYWAIRRYVPAPPVHVLPLALEDLPTGLQAFDTVFSMGVLYHRRSPFDHLLNLRACLKPGGELVLETLVIDGADGNVLVPMDRYARMPNVWFLPSCNTLAAWIEKIGYTDVRLVDLTTTSVDEQRSTAWMTFESLPEALDPDDPRRTIEGHPAPKRATFVAKRPF
ncbi:MAG: tRNA 5-methoxyuridine(34)/uridine 5-oxyacetic acid(34) synthase CmoB [Pseudomonadota bacterium]|nr:tRNA 5-methoxyuridine(34)/uridine 5-oxyacetic acid(34) synthase CmoB [Pseudomonadota bacterium]